MLKRLIHIVALVSLIGFVSHAMAEKIILSTSDYPPYTLINPVNGLYGFDYEVTAAAFAAVGDTVEISFYPWPRALKMVEKNQVHGVITCAKKSERESYILLSDAISGANESIVSHKSYSGTFTTVHQLKELDNVFAVHGYATSRTLHSLKIQHSEPATVESALKMVAKGRGVLYASLENALYLTKLEGLSDELKFHVLNDKEFVPFYICFSRNKDGIRPIIERFNKGLGIIKANGIFRKIHDQYRKKSQISSR